MVPDLTRRQLMIGAAGVTAATITNGCSGAGNGDADRADGTAAGGGRPDGAIPRPAAIVRTNWSADTFALGAYSYMAAGATPADRAALRRPLGERVFFAGEHTNVDHPATVHGAMASGRRAASDLLSVAANGERVIVIGAGISGLVCAGALQRAALDVVALEARDRIGGRLDTVTPDGWSMPIDRGASWVHDIEASDLADRLSDAGISTARWDWDDGRVAASQRTEALAAEIETGVAAAVDAADSAEDNELDLDAATRAQLPDGFDESALQRFFAIEIATEYGADGADLSARWALQEGSEGSDLLVTGGYHGLAVAEASDLEVRLSVSVRGVELRDESVVVTADDGSRLEADRVVVTVPLGVLQSGAISFAPPLPADHLAALDRLGMGVLDKFWFRFDEAWWTEEASFWTIVGPSDSPFVEWYNLRPSTGEPVLLALLGGDTARTWSTASDDEVIDAALISLAKFAADGW